jgi:hypothetical protein
VSNGQQHRERVCMADEKVTSLEVIKPQRRIELRDLAIAAFYPQTRSTTPLTTVAPYMQSFRKPRDNPSPPESVAKPWKKPWDK